MGLEVQEKISRTVSQAGGGLQDPSTQECKSWTCCIYQVIKRYCDNLYQATNMETILFFLFKSRLKFYGQHHSHPISYRWGLEICWDLLYQPWVVGGGKVWNTAFHFLKMRPRITKCPCPFSLFIFQFSLKIWFSDE